MRVRKGRTYTEICVFIGCFLLVFVSILQILVFSRRARSFDMIRTPVNRGTLDEEPNAHNSANVYKRSRFMPGTSARIRARTKAQMEVRELEKSLAKLMRENSMSPDEANAKLQSELYAQKVGNIISRVEEGTWKPSGVNGSPLRSPLSQLNRDVNNNNNHHKDASPTGQQDGRHSDNPVPYIAQSYGLPLSYQRSTPSGGQEIADMGIIKKRKSRPLRHFKDFDNSEEYDIKHSLAEARNFGEENVSRAYEDEYDHIKKQFKDGTELYFDEGLLKANSGSSLDVCPKEPDSLVGNSTEVNLNITVDIEDILKNNSDVQEGGEWKPSSCISRHRVAIIIPYRDRWNHLKVLLHFLIPTLKRQQIHFRIFVVEQYGNETFNKGRIMNAAFREALKLFDFQCVTFHDVDLVPEDDRNMYSCTEQPKHMSISIDKFQYTLPYQGLVGGVLMFKTEHFQLVNGYSNMYWGWGAEDDDMTTRILHRGLRIYRPPSNIARYKMVKHEGRKTSEVAVRVKLLRSAARRSKMEGLNNVQYKLMFTHTEKLFTHFMVDIGHP